MKISDSPSFPRLWGSRVTIVFKRISRSSLGGITAKAASGSRRLAIAQNRRLGATLAEILAGGREVYAVTESGRTLWYRFES